MSDTRINPPKEFILFGDDGIQELELSQNFQESESEGDNIMESMIKEGVLDDIESPKNKSSMSSNLQIDRKFKNEDEESVSSGSENQDEVNFEIIDEGKGIQNCTQKQLGDVNHYSSDLKKFGNPLKVNDSHSYNSSKLVPSARFETISGHDRD